MKWAGANLCLFVGLQALYVAVLAALVRAPLGIALTMFVVGIFLTLPLLAPYLAFVAALPPRWTDRRRRVAAIFASPLLLMFFAIGLGAFGYAPGLFLLLVALPGSLLYGASVRLRRDPPRSVVFTRY
jgi:hypothetical protein